KVKSLRTSSAGGAVSGNERAQGPSVLDAHTLRRAVFGQRVRQILETYEDEARFYSPDLLQMRRDTSRAFQNGELWMPSWVYHCGSLYLSLPQQEVKIEPFGLIS